MSNLNIDILAQSVDNLSRQYEKNLAENENDQLSLQRAGALLEGLKGMFGIEDITLKPVDNTICVTTTFDECVLDLFLDAQNDLKLSSVKVSVSYLFQVLKTLLYNQHVFNTGDKEWPRS